MSHRRMAKATSSAMNVAFGTRKLLSSSLAAAAMTKVDAGIGLLLAENEDEVGHEPQVDEVHGLDEADRQEQDGEQLRPGLGLTGDAGDGLRAGQPVSDGRADGATAQGEATAYQCARGLDRGYKLGICCHYDSSVRGSGSGGASGLRLV